MKTVAFAWIAVAGFFASQVQAASVEGWERPILKARMDVVHVQHEMSDVKEIDLIMTKQDGKGSPTGFVLLIDGQTMFFSVNKTSQDECGNLVYVGNPVALQNQIGIRSYRLLVADQSRRHCIPRPGSRFQALPVVSPWQATLLSNDMNVLQLMGTPEPVFTTQQN